MATMQREVAIPAPSGISLEGTLSVPAQATGVVVFAHGSGSSRFSPRNRFVAGILQQAGLATLLLDLLTGEEEDEERFTGHLRFNIELLAGRLSAAKEWVAQQVETRGLSIGYFGSSTGAAAALVAAAREPEGVGAIVSRGGRPDLAGRELAQVSAPTLLIVGGDDTVVIELNERAYRALECKRGLEIVPGATHLFEEPGTLEQVAALARDWFSQHLATARRTAEEGAVPP